MAELNNEKQAVRKWKNDNIYNTETMLPVSEIRWDTVILKDGWLRWIIKVFGLNLDLKNSEEQEIAIEKYKKFLSWLDFPVQILVRNTYLDLTDYIDFMKDNVNWIENDVLKWQGEQYINFLDDINSKQGLIYTKEFYVIVPYYPEGDEKQSVRKPWRRKLLDAMDNKDSPDKIVQRYRNFKKNRGNLDSRINIVTDWLRSMWISAERLNVSQIISLLFKIYNPLSHKEQAEYET